MLKANKSLNVQAGLAQYEEEHKLRFLASKHRAIVRNIENFKFECEEGMSMWCVRLRKVAFAKRQMRCMCVREVFLEVVQALVEGHEVEAWVTLDDLLKRCGKNSSGESARPIDAAATGLNLTLSCTRKGAERRKFAGTPMVRACEKGDFDSVKALVEGMTWKTGMSVGKC